MSLITASQICFSRSFLLISLLTLSSSCLSGSLADFSNFSFVALTLEASRLRERHMRLDLNKSQRVLIRRGFEIRRAQEVCRRPCSQRRAPSRPCSAERPRSCTPEWSLHLNR